MRRVKKQTDTPMKNWGRSLWEYKCWKKGKGHTLIAERRHAAKTHGPHAARRKGSASETRALKGIFPVTSRESWKHEPNAERYAGNELRVARRKQDSDRRKTRGRDGTRSRREGEGLTEGSENSRLETERRRETMKEEHRGAGDKDGETLRIGTQESLP